MSTAQRVPLWPPIGIGTHVGPRCFGAACIQAPNRFQVVCGEKRGITRSFVDQADLRLQIPYQRRFASSLETASAVAALTFEIMRQRLQASYPFLPHSQRQHSSAALYRAGHRAHTRSADRSGLGPGGGGGAGAPCHKYFTSPLNYDIMNPEVGFACAL
jgi:hypothetical protein